jgi:hypothetical protein
MMPRMTRIVTRDIFAFRLSVKGHKVRGDAMNAGSLPALNKRAKSRGGMA